MPGASGGRSGLGDALGAFVDREIRPDAVSRAMVEIEARSPKRGARQRVDLRAVRSRREDRAGDGDVALQHAREAVTHERARPSDSDRARDVGRAVFVLRAAVDEENAAIDFPVGLFADPIMRDRRIRASAGDGREREILERRARSPKRLQSLHGVDFGQAASRRLTGEPGEEIRHRRAVALMRGARARKLGRIFLRLHERDRIGADLGLAARSLDRLGQIGRYGRGVEGDARPLPAQILDELEQSVGLEHVRMAAEILAGRGREFSSVEKHDRTTLERQIGPADRQRRVGDV